MTITPCKDCTDRHTACHGSCEKYISWKKEWNAQRLKISKIKVFERDAIERTQTAIKNMQKHKK